MRQNSTDLTNLTNVTNLTDQVFFCDVPQEMTDWNNYWICLAYFTEKNVGTAIFGWSVVIGAIIANWVVILYSLTHKITVFDQCIIGHCLV
jgi:hypothetical protein